MKLFIAQLNPIIGDVEGNTSKVLNALDQARTLSCDVVLFPELTLSGYPPEDLLLHTSFITTIERHLLKVVEASQDLLVYVGLPRRNLDQGGKTLFNSVAIICDQKLIGFQDKWLLPDYDVFNERRYFEPGDGLQVIEHKNKRIGLTICEDIWADDQYARDPVLSLKKENIDILLNLSASPYQFHKPSQRHAVCTKAAKKLGVPVIMCCQVGANGQLIFDGYSMHVGPDGCLRGLAKGFEADHVVADLDKVHDECHVHDDPIDALYQALVLGVKDYFVKCGFKTACFGLSGGIDSALVAKIACDALGSEHVLGVCMPSQFSSQGSIDDSLALAKKLKMKTITIPVESAFHVTHGLLEPFFEGKPFDVAEENIQARLRGLLLMALSNKLGHIVLSTGNKSETAVGYSTLYGDMCGGLGVLGDVLKTRVYDLCHYLNRKGEVIPQTIIDKPPSAELRENQSDLDSLPDYTVVDTVLKGYIEDDETLDQITKKHGIEQKIVLDLIQKVYRAEYKRRQGPPILRVSKKSFGVGRRFPIVQKWI